MIAVDPAVQRRGVGRALTAHALEQLRAAGCTLAVVATGGDPGHAPARGLYKAAGFTALPLVRYYRTITTPQNPPTDPADSPSPTLPQDQRRARIAATCVRSKPGQLSHQGSRRGL